MQAGLSDGTYPYFFPTERSDTSQSTQTTVIFQDFTDWSPPSRLRSHIPDLQTATVALTSIALSKTFADVNMNQSTLLGTGPILGIAIPLAVLSLVLTTAVISCLCFRRNKQSTPKVPHHFTGTGKHNVFKK